MLTITIQQKHTIKLLKLRILQPISKLIQCKLLIYNKYQQLQLISIFNKTTSINMNT